MNDASHRPALPVATERWWSVLASALIATALTLVVPLAALAVLLADHCAHGNWACGHDVIVNECVLWLSIAGMLAWPLLGAVALARRTRPWLYAWPMVPMGVLVVIWALGS